jgi:predicted Fe-Mo cluster-binding NifX family protein
LRIAVSASGENLDAAVDPRFGRCPYYVIVETENMQFEAVSNESGNVAHGAGIQAAQTVVGEEVQVVLTGNMGPNAYQALSAAKIKVVTGATGTVQEAVMLYKSGKLKETSSPNVNGHLGVRKGRGMGRGRRWNQ